MSSDNITESAALFDQILDDSKKQLAESREKSATPANRSLCPLHLDREVRRNWIPWASPESMTGQAAEIEPTVYAKIREVAAGNSPWPIFLCGPAGVGKTCAGVCLLKHTKGTGLYFTATSLSERIIQAMNGGFDWGNSNSTKVLPGTIWKYIKKCHLLVLDEIAAREHVSDARYEQLHRVLEFRTGKPLIIISNAEPKQITACYDDRIASRLMAGTPIRVGGADRRIEGVNGQVNQEQPHSRLALNGRHHG